MKNYQQFEYMKTTNQKLFLAAGLIVAGVIGYGNIAGAQVFSVQFQGLGSAQDPPPSPAPGFFAFQGSTANQNSAVLQTFGAYTVTLAPGPDEGLGVGNFSLRTYNNPVDDPPTFTQGSILEGFVQEGKSVYSGLDITIGGLDALTTYNFKVFSYSVVASSGGNALRSDWLANGNLVKDDYSFTGYGADHSVAMTDDQYAFTFSATTDASGNMEILGHTHEGLTIGQNTVINGLQVFAVPEPGSVALLGLAGGSLLLWRRRRA